MKSSLGYPSILNSVLMYFFSSSTSVRRICRSSGLGCTVMPCPPNCSQSRATCSKSGLLPPRALRNVANLLIFTLSFVINAWYNEENTVNLLKEARNSLPYLCREITKMFQIMRILRGEMRQFTNYYALFSSKNYLIWQEL